MIAVGKSYPLVVRWILTSHDIDQFIKWYGNGNTEYDKKLYDKLKAIREVWNIQGLERLGYTDENLLNWE